MNKSDLVETAAEAAGITKAQAGKAVDSVLGAITGALAAGEDVSLPGFGKFSVGERAAREGKNPTTGETIQIPASRTVKFKAGAQLKAAVQR